MKKIISLTFVFCLLFSTNNIHASAVATSVTRTKVHPVLAPSLMVGGGIALLTGIYLVCKVSKSKPDVTYGGVMSIMGNGAIAVVGLLLLVGGASTTGL